MNSPFPYNNYIYLVTLASPKASAIKIRPSQSNVSQPATVPFPASSMSLIV